MPLYNAFPYIRSAIESILSQTYPNFRLLVINDGSTDGSEQVAASFNDSRVILWHQENQGPGAAMNRATQYVLDQKIPYLARMDSDDISMPNRLETQILLLEKYPAAAACSANCHYIDAESERVIGSSTVSISPGLIKWEITHGLRGLIQPVCTFRTSALAAIGGYRMQFILAEEVDTFLRLADKYELRNCRDFLCKIRIRPNSLSIRDAHKNILYQFYALDCAKQRQINRQERGFDEFNQSISLSTKYRVWREEYLLKFWRNHLKTHNSSGLVLAGLLDPRRVVIRLLRGLDKSKSISMEDDL
jgi:glycosyltransferase involved in cell wall biosynthesis